MANYSLISLALTEAQVLQAELGLALQDGMGEPGELDDIRMTEQRRLLGIKSDT